MLVYLLVILAGHELTAWEPYGVQIKSFFLAVSESLKALLSLVLPFVIFGCVYNCMMTQRGRAFRFILLLFCFVTLSNALSSLFGYALGCWHVSRGTLLSFHLPEGSPHLMPFWEVPAVLKGVIQKLDNRLFLGLGLLVGLYAGLARVRWGLPLSRVIEKFNHFFLGRFFIPVLPLFVAGYALKMEHEQILKQVFGSIWPLCVLSVCGILGYVFLMFGCIARFEPRRWWLYIRNILPAGLTGFMTTSSLMTMPVTLQATEKNLEYGRRPEQAVPMAQAIIPATVNIHLIGNSIVVMLMVAFLGTLFHKQLPSVGTYVLFLGEVLLAKFAVAAVPGGGIMVMQTLLETRLGFTGEMKTLVLSLYILLDPIITAGNVMGNGAFAVWYARLQDRWNQG